MNFSTHVLQVPILIICDKMFETQYKFNITDRKYSKIYFYCQALFGKGFFGFESVLSLFAKESKSNQEGFSTLVAG